MSTPAGHSSETHDLTTEPVVAELEDPRQRAFLLALIETCGQIGRAAAAAGISRWTVRRWKVGYDGRPPDPAYLCALAIATDLAADRLEEVAIRRATEGMKSYKFHNKTGEPLEHPDRCECGHHRRSHALEAVEMGEGDVPERVRTSCAECSCSRFQGGPYYEVEISDRLHQFLLRGAKPEKYAERRITSTTLRNLNWEALASTPSGQAAIARIARGEHPYSVLASMADKEAGRLLAPGVELGGPGTRKPTTGRSSNGGGSRDHARDVGPAGDGQGRDARDRQHRSEEDL